MNLYRVFLRFVRMFVAGGFSSMLLFFSQNPSLDIFTDTRTIATAVGIAFLTGGLAAIDKAFRDWNS